MSADGLRSPRSTWLRYGLETPACSASWRREIFACSRCCLMYSPMLFMFAIHNILARPLAVANLQQAAGAAYAFGSVTSVPLATPVDAGRPSGVVVCGSGRGAPPPIHADGQHVP